MMAMLQVDDADHASTAHDRHRQESFVTVFWKLVKKLKARIVSGTLGNGHWLAVLSDPSSNSLPNAKLQSINDIRVRILGSAKDQFIAFEHIDKAGVTLYEGSGKINNTCKNLMKAIGRTQADGDLMEHVNM
jgi:hypothetical protein